MSVFRALWVMTSALPIVGCGGWAETCGRPTLSERAASVVVSDLESCARTAGGEVTCWGGCARLSREATVTHVEPDEVLWAGGDTVCVASSEGLRCSGGDAFEPVLGVASRPGWVGIEDWVGLMIVDDHLLRFPSVPGVRDGGRMPLEVRGRWPLPPSFVGVLHYGGAGVAVRRDGAIVGTRGDEIARLAIGDLVFVTGSVQYGCAMHERGALYCWAPRSLPSAPPVIEHVAITDVAEVLAAGLQGPHPDTIPFGAHACARRTNGEVWCWGDDGCDAQPIRLPGPINACDRHRAEHPEQVLLPGPATDIAVAPHHACAVTEDGSVYCWGSNFWGALGDGTRIDSAIPVRALAGANSDAASVGAP